MSGERFRAKDERERKMRNAFLCQRSGSVRRGIEFSITWEEWRDWWLVDDRWSRRGSGRDQLVMARRFDRGGYALGNIYCATNSQNGADRSIARGGESSRPERRAALSKNAKAVWASPGVRSQRAAAAARRHADREAVRLARAAERPNRELGERISVRMMRLWDDPEYRARQCEERRLRAARKREEALSSGWTSDNKPRKPRKAVQLSFDFDGV